jgi:hypothetical protein
MAWTAPLTAVFNTTLTAAQWNTHIRDNSNETMPAKATAAGRWFVSTGANAIAERVISGADVATSQTTTSTSYTDLTTVGPSVTATTGTRALVFFACAMSNSTDNAETWASVTVSGATTIAASDTWAMMMDGIEISNQNAFGMWHYFSTLTAGSNTFKLQYKVGSGTGTFLNRRILVIAM